MTSLASGAVELPLAHLSVRAAWHDTDWTGRVCASPSTNHACTILKNIKGRKDSEAEELDREKAWSELLDSDRVPPCVFERAGFMRPTAFQIVREHAYAGRNSGSHGHFAATTHRMPPYSFEATPYRWVMREEARRYADDWGIGYDEALEKRADDLMKWQKPTTWVQDHRNQLALLDSFFSAIKPAQSLVFVYAKDIPVIEDRPPGFRALIGAGFVESVGAVQEWEYEDGPRPLRSIMWERSVGHTIRPEFSNGFVLPYHALLENQALQGEDLLPFIAHTPGEHFDEFSYVTERVGHDGAIAALLELSRVVDLLPGIADGPWGEIAAWLSDRIADAWTLRGPYPGLGAALTAAGLERGGLIAHRLTESLDDPSADPWPALTVALRDSEQGVGPAADLVGRMARKAWAAIAADERRLALLRMLARFPLSSAQARRMFDPDSRAGGGIAVRDDELLENPYLLYEVDRGREGSIGFSIIDRGLFPRDAAATAALAAYPLPEPVTESSDDRRVRAACVSLLETAAADEGHSLLDEPRLRKRLATIKLDPLCDPTTELFKIAASGFESGLVEVPLAREEGRGWQLARLASAAELVEADVNARLEAGVIDVSWAWRDQIDAVIDEPLDAADNEEETARHEKALAVEILARSRVAALVGPAGTGKTTMLKALCSHPDVSHAGVLLLAPTGKARVQLGDRVGAKALTLAQHLRHSGRWDWEFGYRVLLSAPRDSGYATVIVDEASMLTEEMLAALLDSLTGVERFVLCGDHRQLPPIGAGRPFADIIGHLRTLDAGSAGSVAELTVGRRQKTAGGTTAGRDDLAVASLFSVDGVSPAADEAFGRVLAGEGDGTVTVNAWETEDELHEQVAEFLAGDPALGIARGDSDALKRSLGATGTYKEWASFEFGDGARGAERWQMLTPVRSRPGGVAGLNQLVRRTWRKGNASQAIRSWKIPPPLGGDEILFHDKVMCAQNHRRDGQTHSRSTVKADVANGEIGMAVSWWKRKCIRVEFSTQPDLQFTFWTSELNSDKERGAELLEVAYAITIHKAQGSQFGTTIVVVPNPCPLLSPELLYTALTRQRDRVVVFVQGDPNDLRRLGSPARSETARRLTRLFRAPDPFETPEGDVLDGSHVHRTLNDEMVRSKSEVIVANALHALGIDYVYEQDLVMPDGSRRSPDFTVTRLGKPTVYWEHLGMLDKHGYRADWEAKREWYASHGIVPWTEGGGKNGVLVCSTEGESGPGIDSVVIERRARDVFGIGPD